MNEGVPLIRLSGVEKRFGANHALRGIDLAIGKGDSLVLIGGSGSGKTLILKCIMGLVPFSIGRVEFEGADVARFDSAERQRFLDHFGMTFQKSGLFDSLTVWENVAFRLLQEGMGLTQAKERAIDKLAAVGLDAPTADLYPAELSGGMQKRVGLARAIANDPDILFLDEPTAGLDPIMTNVINELIVDIVERLGATVVSITSDMSSLKVISQRVAMVHEGRIIWEGATETAMESGDPFVDQFVHSRAEGPVHMAVKAL
ncbi:MAG: ATP-binding cassette domain-containing protein [Rhodospirillaceae bacterium]